MDVKSDIWEHCAELFLLIKTLIFHFPAKKTMPVEKNRTLFLNGLNVHGNRRYCWALGGYNTTAVQYQVTVTLPLFY